MCLRTQWKGEDKETGLRAAQKQDKREWAQTEIKQKVLKNKEIFLS